MRAVIRGPVGAGGAVPAAGRSRPPATWRCAAAAAAVAASCAGGCASPSDARAGEHRPMAAGRSLQHGHATWYGPGFDGNKTASGERYDQDKMTAAHRTLPFGTLVRVTNRRTGRAVIVRINDRGPFGNKSRIIDVSLAAARQLGMLHSGVIPCTVEVIQRPGASAGKRAR